MTTISRDRDMALVSILILGLTLAFLVYKSPSTMQRYLPSWLWWQIASSDGADAGQSHRSATSGDERQVAVNVDDESGDSSEAETTPKASSSKAYGAVPSFSLSGDDEEENKGPLGPKVTSPPFPAVNSPQRASTMPPPPLPTLSAQQKPVTTQMPPPARPTLAPRGLAPTQTQALRVPTTGPLPNRGPPPNSQQRVSGSLAPTATKSNSRGKILLKPGHSPMDWATLTRSPFANLSGVSTFQRVTPSQLRQMTGRKGKPAWSSWQGKVYNITPYIDFHPGGGPEIMKAAGRDGEKLFMETHPWVNWENMLGSCLVGIMVPEGYHDVKSQSEESELERLD